MSGERSQDEGERYGISEPHGYAKAMSYYEKLKLGSFCHIDPCLAAIVLLGRSFRTATGL